MKVVLKEIVISSCRECPHHGYTESDWYCKKMQLGKYTFQEITNIDSIHERCPLNEKKTMDKSTSYFGGGD